VIGFGTSVEVVSEEQKASLLDARPCCWLIVNSRCARLECMRVPLVKGKQQKQILRENMISPVRAMGKLKINQPVVWRSCTSQNRYSHSYKNSTPCGQTAGGDRAPHIYLYVSTYIHIHITHICSYICKRIHPHIYTHTYIHIYVYTYIYIQIHQKNTVQHICSLRHVIYVIWGLKLHIYVV